jgi:hypothetical protein
MKHSNVINRSFYDNVIILNNDGTPLSTVSNHKAKWYLRKNLGVEATPPEGYPRAIQLNFPADVARPRFVHDIVICKDQCVFCGISLNLTVHHVVPHVIRQHFPLEHKARARNWCVLLCFKHHMELEEDLKKLYYDDKFPPTPRDGNTNITLQKIKTACDLSRLPLEKLEALLAMSDYKTVDDIPMLTAEARKQRNSDLSMAHREAIRVWALQYIEDHGGIEGTKAFFREHFLTYNPTHLPEGWLQELKVA